MNMVGKLLAPALLVLSTPLVVASTIAEFHDKQPTMDGVMTRDKGDCDHKECKHSGDPAGVPEPGTLALMVLGLGGLALAARRRRK